MNIGFFNFLEGMSRAAAYKEEADEEGFTTICLRG